MRIHLIDVGQGAAHPTRVSRAAAVLVDAGGEKNPQFDGRAALINYLDTFFGARPDLNRTLPASSSPTRPHADHYLAAADVLGHVHGRAIVTDGQRDCATRMRRKTRRRRRGMLARRQRAVLRGVPGAQLGRLRTVNREQLLQDADR